MYLPRLSKKYGFMITKFRSTTFTLYTLWSNDCPCYIYFESRKEFDSFMNANKNKKWVELLDVYLNDRTNNQDITEFCEKCFNAMEKYKKDLKKNKIRTEKISGGR